jgi:dTDP-4-amino-4,6-dideoxygalactose transaminase
MAAKIPLVDLRAQYAQIGPEIDAAIRRVIESSGFILGPEVEAFEEAFAAYCGAKHCVGVASGTSALELALRAFHVGAGDEVITVAHTFIATAEAISAVGATPVFVDIEPDTYTMDPQALAAAITPRTRAVIPVHIYGQPANMSRILEIGRAHGIAVIEDAAQAHGATWDGAMAGTLADAACFSFYPGKNLGAYGDAGAVTTDLPEVAAQVRSLRNHGRQSKYLHDQIGFGLRIDALQAAILHAKLPYLEEWVVARNRVAERYTQGLSDTDLTLPAVSPRARHGWHLYVLRSPERDAMLEHLRASGVSAGVHYPVPLHLQPAYAHLGYAEGSLPVSEEVARTCLSLPMYPELSEEQIDAVVAAVRAAIPERVLPS